MYFRQIVNKYRNEYIQSARDLKVKIAKQVIDIIHNNGGRFLQETESGSGKYFEISHPRAIEKCCQALREKEKSNSSRGNPMEKLFMKKESPTSTCKLSGAKIKKPLEDKREASLSGIEKEKRNHKCQSLTQSANKDHSDSENRGDCSTSHSSNTNDSSLMIMEDDDIKLEQSLQNNDISQFMESPMDRIKKIQNNEMLKRLERFVLEHHHVGVPPGWSVDPDLADWCTFQRQRLRMAMRGYRKLNSEETKLLKKLSAMNFVWDYDEWHWNRRLQEYKNQHTYANQSITAKMQEVDTSLSEWLNDQKEQHLSKTQPLSNSRLMTLRDAGISFP